VSAPTLSIESLSVAVRTPDKSTRRVVDEVSFTIDPGRMVALVGESAAARP
jgi:ABC-type glutathione transport system ATPase component